MFGEVGDSGIYKMLVAEHWTFLRKRDEGSSHCCVDLRQGDHSQYLGYINRVEKPHSRRGRGRESIDDAAGRRRHFNVKILKMSSCMRSIVRHRLFANVPCFSPSRNRVKLQFHACLELNLVTVMPWPMKSG